MSTFRTQLFPDAPKDRFTSFSFGHIIPPSSLHAVFLTTAPRTNRVFEFKWDVRPDTALLNDLGTGAVVPGGLAVFVPSYGFLEAGQPSSDTFNISLRRHNTGALMFAVVGAKLPKHINLSDDLARTAVKVDMPHTNAARPKLAERMRYVREFANTSGGLEKGASKPDAAALILLERHYARPDIRNRLPGWIRNEVKTVEQFGPAMAGLGAFFRGKKQQQDVIVDRPCPPPSAARLGLLIDRCNSPPGLHKLLRSVSLRAPILPPSWFHTARCADGAVVQMAGDGSAILSKRH
ncbi:unnamed protein product [Tilletia controversa]|nr:unnamed protein product [Tilletia controversa]